MINFRIPYPNRSKSAKKSKKSNVNIKLSTKVAITEDAILNTRKHTIPVPFIFQRNVREKKSQVVSLRALKSSMLPESPANQQKSSRLMLLSPRRNNIASPRLIKSAIKERPTSCSPCKKVQFKEETSETKLSMSKQKQWKKIFASIKTTLKNEIQPYFTKKVKKKCLHTIQDIGIYEQ